MKSREVDRYVHVQVLGEPRAGRYLDVLNQVDSMLSFEVSD
jgi:hypothetical protein